MAWEVDEWDDEGLRDAVWQVRFRDGDHYPIRLTLHMHADGNEKRATANRVCEALNRADLDELENYQCPPPKQVGTAKVYWNMSYDEACEQRDRENERK